MVSLWFSVQHLELLPLPPPLPLPLCALRLDDASSWNGKMRNECCGYKCSISLHFLLMCLTSDATDFCNRSVILFEREWQA